MSDIESLASLDLDPDMGRRMLLLGGTAGLGVIGAGFAAWPFYASWKPSARARVVGGPVEVFIGDLQPGQILRGVEWRGQPMGILRRTQEMLDLLGEVEPDLRDPNSDALEQQPEYARNAHRSIRPEYLVMNMYCTHLGCVPELITEVGAQPFEENWKGGFFCPCHKSKFDLSGRVYAGVPAPSNMVIPPYTFLDDENILIGVDPEGAA